MTMIEGNKIRLRNVCLDDLPVYRRWQQPGHKWQALDGPYYPKPTPEQVEKTIEMITGRIVAENWPPVASRLMIADKKTDGFLGQVSRYWISEETNWTAVGIVIFDPDYWQKGIGYEALGLWSDYLFEQFPDWVRLDLRTWSGNQGMIHLAQKLGYRQEACFRQARIVDGAYYDGLGFGVLREEWYEMFPNGFVAKRRN